MSSRVKVSQLNDSFRGIKGVSFYASLGALFRYGAYMAVTQIYVL